MGGRHKRTAELSHVCRYVDVLLGSIGRRAATFIFYFESLRVTLLHDNSSDGIVWKSACRLVLLFWHSANPREAAQW